MLWVNRKVFDTCFECGYILDKHDVIFICIIFLISLEILDTIKCFFCSCPFIVIFECLHHQLVHFIASFLNIEERVYSWYFLFFQFLFFHITLENIGHFLSHLLLYISLGYRVELNTNIKIIVNNHLVRILFMIVEVLVLSTL